MERSWQAERLPYKIFLPRINAMRAAIRIVVGKRFACHLECSKIVLPYETFTFFQTPFSSFQLYSALPLIL